MRQDDRTLDDMRSELHRLKDSLCDIEDIHAFTFVKTSVHIGAEKAQNMQEEYDEECRILRDKIAVLEKSISEREARETS